jgi:hypothetical protein
MSDIIIPDLPAYPVDEDSGLRQLEEMQFEILPSEFEDTGYPFGIGLQVSIETFDPGEMTWLEQTGQNSHNGARHFGRDTTMAPSWTWTMHTDGDNTADALRRLREFSSAWRARKIARVPSAVLPLRYRVGHRTRRVYGRPRRLASPPSNLILGGYIPITASFDLVDDLHYADTLSSAILTYNADGDGGFVLPSVLPIVTQPQSERALDVINDGDEDAPLVIRFEGPVVNPSLQGPGWNVSLKMEISAGEYVEIDTRPWRMTVLRNGSASVAGRLGRRQRLSDIALPAGKSTLRYRGASSSATSSCAVSWRSAYSSL